MKEHDKNILQQDDHKKLADQICKLDYNFVSKLFFEMGNCLREQGRKNEIDNDDDDVPYVADKLIGAADFIHNAHCDIHQVAKSLKSPK